MILAEGGGVCSGVVVAADVVLTAAHCVPAGRQVRVHYREGGQPVLLEPAGIARHPEFRPNAVAERARSIDLALIRLPRPLPERFGAAELAAEVEGDRVTVAGFGAGREADPSSMGVWRSAELSVTRPFGESRVLLWARGGPGQGGCQGDSGGPLLDGRSAVVAITSWTTGERSARCGALTQGILIGSQRGWIDGALARWGRMARWRG